MTAARLVKTITRLFVSIAAVLALTGCGGGNDSPTSGPPVQSEWRAVFANDDEPTTRWRCTGTTLLIENSESHQGGVAALVDDKRCGGTK